MYVRCNTEYLACAEPLRRAGLSAAADTHVEINSINADQSSQVNSAFYPPWDGKMSTSQRAVMFCGWGVKAGTV